MSETVLDDRDSAVTYVGEVWSQGGAPREYRETTSWTMSSGATATIDFYGKLFSAPGRCGRGNVNFNINLC